MKPAEDKPIEPNRLAIAIGLMVGAAIGSSPYLIFTDRAALASIVASAFGGIAFVYLRRFRPQATERPGLGEWLLFFWTATAWPAIGSLGSLLWYAIAFWGSRPLNFLAHAFGLDASLDPTRLAIWISSFIFASCSIVGALRSARWLPPSLYPETAGTRSVFYALASRPSRALAAAVVCVIALALLTFFTDPGGVWFPVILNLLLFYSSYPLARLTSLMSISRDRSLDALAGILREAGYEVTSSWRSGKSDVDPLLTALDLLARDPSHTFAIDVEYSRPSAPPVEWDAASSIRTAASVLRSELASRDGEPEVDAVLVLVGGRVAPSLRAFVEEERVRLVHFENPYDLGSARGTRRQRAESLLHAAGLLPTRIQPGTFDNP